MKKLLICFFCCFSVFVSAQTSNEEILKDEFPTYQGVIYAEGKSSEGIYAAVKSWVAVAFKSANDVIQLDDKANGKLIVKGLSSFDYKAMMTTVPCKCYFTLTVETKDDRFRYTIDITDVTEGSLGNSAVSRIISKPNSKYSKILLSGVDKAKNDMIEGLRNISYTNDDRDNW